MIWEEFTQSIHTFIEDKKNLAQHTHKKKKATLIVISRIRFTKLIIHYLQSKHRFHPRLDYPLHLPNKEHVLRYLKFSAKGTKREVFGMPIPGNLVTADIQDLMMKRLMYKGHWKKAKRVFTMRLGVYFHRWSLENQSLGNINRFRRFRERAKRKRTSTPTGSFGHVESSSLYVELGLTDSEAGPNTSEQDEGQAGPNPGDAVASQPLLSHVVHVGPNLEHMDLEATDVSTQPHPEQLDEGFGDLFFNDKPSEANNEKTTAETKAESMVPESPNVHRPLQATATETTTTTTIHPPPAQPQQSTTDSMLMKHIGELKHIMANLIQDNKHLEERLDSHGARLYTLENLDIPQQVSKAMDEIVTDAVDWAIQAQLRPRFRDLPKADMKEIIHQRMWETNSYKTHEDYMMMYEALEKSMNRDHTDELLKDLAGVRKKKKKSRDSPNTPLGSPPHQPPPPPPPASPSGTSGSPKAFGSSQVPPTPPPPPSTNQEGQSHGSIAPSSSMTAASAKYKAWIMTNTRIKPSVSLTHDDLHMDDDMALDAQVHLSDDEDIENAHIPKVNLRQDWWKPLEEDRRATPEPDWSIPSSDLSIPKNN
nr:hypothetical protein [Tanacetum cinerariifolium]